MEITVTVRDLDVATLTELAETQWRGPEQQASAMLEAALHAARAKSDPTTPRRTRSRRNGALAGATV